MPGAKALGVMPVLPVPTEISVGGTTVEFVADAFAGVEPPTAPRPAATFVWLASAAWSDRNSRAESTALNARIAPNISLSKSFRYKVIRAWP